MFGARLMPGYEMEMEVFEKECESLWLSPINEILPLSRGDEHAQILYEHHYDECGENWNDDVYRDIFSYEMEMEMQGWFKDGWVRVRRYGTRWDIHGYKIDSASKRGKVKALLNFLLEGSHITMDTEFSLLNEHEGFWGNQMNDAGRHFTTNKLLGEV